MALLICFHFIRRDYFYPALFRTFFSSLSSFFLCWKWVFKRWSFWGSAQPDSSWQFFTSCNCSSFLPVLPSLLLLFSSNLRLSSWHSGSNGSVNLAKRRGTDGEERRISKYSQSRGRAEVLCRPRFYRCRWRRRGKKTPPPADTAESGNSVSKTMLWFCLGPKAYHALS